MDDKELDFFTALWLIISLLIGLILICSALFGCNGTTYDDVSSTSPGGSGGSLTYVRINREIIAPKCLACHGPGPKDLSTYSALMKYVVPGNSQGSKLCTTVATKKMPPSNPLPQESVDTLCEWIHDGAPL